MIAEGDLIRRCRAGDREAWDDLLDRYQKPLFSFCRKLAARRDEAGDLFQDTWVKVVESIGRFDETRRFLPWLFTICLNRYRDGRRRRQRWWRRFGDGFGSEETAAAEKAFPSGETAEDRLDRTEWETALRGCVNRLGELGRTTVILFYFREFEISEIAGILGIPEGTVKSRLAAARAKIKEWWEERA